MASNFNNDLVPEAAEDRGAGVPATPAPAAAAPAAAHPPATSDVPESAAYVRFRSCRWQQPKEEGHDTEFCTHREVKPYAGTAGFDAEAWCPDCQYYKLRRAPKKKNPSEEFTY